ncbi:monocarboxylate transporter 12-like [Mercenaria mercenaria]|uniref:monocarboxylate transporter 12-like n=1 Tax=Mercenaria mercenaria TaxID=6596 RepID=UPI00234E9F1B|nr:monocarboxylate transporter 12-like [Mercenaria mercenaria]XP_053406813.1 monocarboxylate transporter 12-like [Mercenaria mercenaria]
MSETDRETTKEKNEKELKSQNGTLLKNRASSYPQFADLDEGWAWVVLAGSFGTFCLMGATQFASGIIHMILLHKYQASVSLTSVAGAVHVSIISIGAPVSTFILEKCSCRIAIVTSGCLFFVGYFGTAFAPNIECVIFTYGVVAGVGGAVGYTANMVVVGYYFQRKRNIAMGIAVAGAGVGISLLAQVMHFIYNQYGSFGFFLLISGIFSQSIVFGMVSKPSKLELYTKCRRAQQIIAEKNKYVTNCISIRSHLAISTNKAVLCLSLGLFNFCLGTYLVYLHLPNYIVEMGFQPSVAANLVSLSGILTIVGRILTGCIATVKYIRDDILYCLPMFILGIMTIVYPHISSTFAGHLTYAIFLGLFFGNAYVLTASVSVKHIGIVNLAKAIGIQYCFAGLGALLGPIMAGIIVDAGGSYEDAFYTAGAFLLLAGITSGMATYVSGPESHETGNNMTDIEMNEETSKLR